MKKILLILSFVLSVLFLLDSCQDSFNIESNKIVKIIDSTIHHNQIDTVPINADSANFNGIEHTKKTNGGAGDTSNIFWNNKIVNFSCEIDTGVNPPIIWLSVNFTNTELDTILRDTVHSHTEEEHISSIEIYLDSIEATGSYNLNGTQGSNLWSKTSIYNIGQQKYYSFEANYTPLTITFTQIQKSHEPKYIEAEISGTFQSSYYQRTYKLSSILYIYYK